MSPKTQTSANFSVERMAAGGAPGSYVAKAILCGCVDIGCGVAAIFVARRVLGAVAFAFVAGAVISLSYIPQARRHCEQNGGAVCPACGHKNEVKWNS